MLGWIAAYLAVGLALASYGDRVVTEESPEVAEEASKWEWCKYYVSVTVFWPLALVIVLNAYLNPYSGDDE